MNKKWVLVGFPHEIAREVMDDIESSCGKTVSRRIRSKYELRTEFTDGTILRHMRASDSIRGYKFDKMWCDKTIDEEYLHRVIIPMYSGKLADIIWL